MNDRQLSMLPAEPMPSKKAETSAEPARIRQNVPNRNFEVKHPDDTKQCSVCDAFGSLFTYINGKPYCPGTDWGKPSCAPLKE